MPPATVAKPASILDLRGYIAELDRWSEAAARLSRQPQEAATLEKELPESWQVNVDGQTFSVSTGWLRDDLRSIQSNRGLAPPISKQIEADIGLLRADAKALDEESRSASGADAARRKLDGILRRHEFRGLQGPGWLDAARERLIIWLSDLLDSILARLGGHPRASRGLMWVVAVAVALGFMTFLFVSFIRRSPEAALDLDGPSRAVRGSADWAREALEASRRGDYRDAIRLAYWAGVYRLGEAGFWQVDRTRTHREYLRLLPPAPDDNARRTALSEVTYRFERVWYGRQPTSADDFRFVVTQLEMLGCAFPSTPATGNS